MLWCVLCLHCVVSWLCCVLRCCFVGAWLLMVLFLSGCIRFVCFVCRCLFCVVIVVVVLCLVCVYEFVFVVHYVV